MDKEKFNLLIDKVNSGTASDQELAKYSALLNQITSGKEEWDAEHLGSEEEVKAELLQRIEAEMGSQKVLRLNLWRSIAAAAAILIFLSAGGYFLLHKRVQPIQQVAQNQTHNIAPGGNKAIITLGNGKTIVLNGAKNGNIASQGNVTIKKTADGQIRYTSSNNNTTPQGIVYNTATTPRGGQYQFILSDGTKVWLNAASSIKYPVAFVGNERKVELTGEAYFEVAHNARMPFRVVSNGQVVEVLGTHFNINSYANEAVTKTTLLEGKVKVTRLATGEIEQLLPGNQSQLNEDGSFRKVENVDTDKVIAWKNGAFDFDDEDIQSMMRQLCRWYDVEVEYQGNIPDLTFSGGIERNLSLQQVLMGLEKTDVHFKVENRKIIVTQ